MYIVTKKQGFACRSKCIGRVQATHARVTCLWVWRLYSALVAARTTQVGAVRVSVCICGASVDIDEDERMRPPSCAARPFSVHT